MSKLKYLIVPTVIACTTLASDIQLYPISAIFLSDEANFCTNFKKGLASTSDDNTSAKGREAFVSDVKNTFKTTDTIDKMNLNKTFIAYLKVPRVSLYKIEKSEQRANYYLPISATFTIANMKTGEIVYTNGFTNYSIYEGLISGMDDAQQQKMYADEMFNLTGELTKKAKEVFNPFSIETKIIDTYEQYFILNQGQEAGIVLGDTLESSNGDEIKVEFSDKQYSVGSVRLGHPELGEVYSKVNSGSLSAIKRPKVGLAENEVAYTSFSWDTMKQFFTDKIGEKAAFSVIPLDKTFFLAQDSAFIEAKSGLSQEFRNKRALPSMFIKVDIGTPYYWRTPSDKEYANFDNYAINSCALTCNSLGIITYSSCASEKQQDQVIGNSRFSNDATTEKITKNSVLKIAEDFSTNIKRLTKKAVITQVNNDIVTMDSAVKFNKDENVQVFRSIDTIQGIKDVKVPIAEAKILSDDTLKAKIFFDKKVKVGDELVLETLGSNSQDKLLSFGETVMLPGEKLSQFDMMAHYIIAKNSKYNCIIWDDVKENLNKTFSSSFGFETSLKMTTPKEYLTVVPRYQVTLKSTTCDEDEKMCHNIYNIYSDVKIYNGNIEKENVIFNGGYEADTTITYPKNDTCKIDYELTEEALKLLAKAAQDIKL
jgi:hypothetical protein